MLVLALLGCDGRPLIGVGGRPGIGTTSTGDTSVIDSDTPTVDTDVGGVRISYEFSALMEVDSCAAAGLDTLAVVLWTTESTVGPVDFPCDDAPIHWTDAPAGGALLKVTGGDPEATGIWWDGGSTHVDVSTAVDSDVHFVLRCRENNVDDGCGGA